MKNDERRKHAAPTVTYNRAYAASHVIKSHTIHRLVVGLLAALWQLLLARPASTAYRIHLRIVMIFLVH